MSWLNKDEIARKKSIARQRRKDDKKLKREFRQKSDRVAPIIKRLLRDVGKVCFGKYHFLPNYKIEYFPSDYDTFWYLLGPGRSGTMRSGDYYLPEFAVSVGLRNSESALKYALAIEATKYPSGDKKILYSVVLNDISEDTLEDDLKKVLRPLSEELASYIFGVKY